MFPRDPSTDFAFTTFICSALRLGYSLPMSSNSTDSFFVATLPLPHSLHTISPATDLLRVSLHGSIYLVVCLQRLGDDLRRASLNTDVARRGSSLFLAFNPPFANQHCSQAFQTIFHWYLESLFSKSGSSLQIKPRGERRPDQSQTSCSSRPPRLRRSYQRATFSTMRLG